jgi:hypothetical protein
VTYAREERAALAALLAETGPDAPTLCEGWQTRGLAAHLVLRERRPDAAAGVMGGPLAGYTARVQRRYLGRYSYPELVGLIVAKNSAPSVTVTGSPAELTLWSMGRARAARVTLDGLEDAVAKLTAWRG